MPAKDPRGFSEPPNDPDKTFYWPIYTTKRALLEGLRFHVAKFASKKTIDPTSEQDFTRPVRLHRRDPRAPPSGAGAVKDEDGVSESKEGVLDDKEREQQEILHQEREAQKQAELAQIAPTAATRTANAKKGKPKRKTEQVYRTNLTPEAAKAQKLRYEETLPWHLEDFDNKNIWVGGYESALSDMHVAMTIGTKSFSVIPVEKWYKFTPKNQFKALTIEEAEARMSKKVKEPRWMMKSIEEERQKKEEDRNRKQASRLFLGKWDDQGASAAGPAKRSELADANDLDFEEDRFADDEENPLFEGEEEEAKEAENRIKRDHLQANIFNLKDEHEYDKADDEDKKEEQMARKLGRRVRRALRDHEKNMMYEDDTDSNPYTDESATEDSEEERRKEEEGKPDEKGDKGKGQDKDGSRLPSGASTKGSNTPSGRMKHSDPLKKAGSHLKRPGSPTLSEISGTESARKKSKKQHSSSQPTGTSTPKPLSRPMTPISLGAAVEGSRQRNVSTNVPVDATKAGGSLARTALPDSKKRGRTGAGSGSDGDATGGEMSDGASRRKISKPKATSNSPRGSRAGSPTPLSQGVRSTGAKSTNGSRAGSPTAGTSFLGGAQSIAEAEIIASIPPRGTTINELLNLFKGRITESERTPFIALVRRVSTFDRVNKKLMPRAAAGANGSSGGASSSTTRR